MEAFAASTLYCDDQTVGTPEGTEAVIISVASEAALGAAQSAVPDAEFALLQTSSVGTFLSATLSPEQAAHLLSSLGKTVHYISCDSPVSTAQTVKPSDPVFDVYCGPDVVAPTDGDYVVSFNDKDSPTEADISAIVNWLKSQGGAEFFTLDKIQTGDVAQFVSGTFSAEALQALMASKYMGMIQSIRCEQEATTARVRCGEGALTEEQAEGRRNYIITVTDKPNATQQVMAIVTWLAETYDASDEVGTIQSQPNSPLLGAYLEAEMTWDVIEALLASKLGPSVKTIDCDQEVTALEPGAGGIGAGVVGGGSVEDNDTTWSEKIRCDNQQMEPPEGVAPYFVHLNASDKALDPEAKLAELTGWLVANYGDSADLEGTPSQQSASLSGPHFTARMSRAAIEGLLAAHGAAIATVSCDPTVGIDDVEDGQEVGGGAERLWEKVQCGGQQMEPPEGVSAFTVRLNTSDQSVDMKVRMVAITDWLSAQYGGTAQIGSSPALSPSRATFTADLTWTALGALLASEHGAAISGVECDLAAAIPATVQPTPTPYRDEEELRLLQQMLSEKFYCHGSTTNELPATDATYLILLESETGSVSTDELVDWLTTNYGDSVDGLQDTSRLLPIVTGQLSRESVEAMLLEFHDSIRKLECDMPASVVTVGKKSDEESSSGDDSAAYPLHPFAVRLALLPAVVAALLIPMLF
uniref:Uncharacterized protein n=1 Tax=Tetraselmis chuii TaxID=63592 RepID=A0A7S1X9H8_9CHLO